MFERSFLFDENISSSLYKAFLQTYPSIPYFFVGDGIAPPKGTKDPEILDWISEYNCWLVTDNRASMPVHLADHLEAGKSIMGIIQLPKFWETKQIIDELHLIWEVAEIDEYENQIVYLPL